MAHTSINILLLIAGGYLLTLITWALYLAIMNLIPHRHNLHPVAKVNAYILLAIGITFDVLLNITVGSLLFLEPPHHKRLLLTARLVHHIGKPTWRGTLARWICEHLLDQFDRGGHCK